MIATAAQLAEWHGVDRRTVTNWLNEDPPCPSVKTGKARAFDTAAVHRWLVERAVAKERESWKREQPAGEDEVKEARDRKVIVETRLLELELEEAEGRVVPLDLHESRVQALAERLAAKVKGLGGYLGDVQLAASDVDAALLLERISDDLLRTLVAVGDELEEAGGGDGSSAAA